MSLLDQIKYPADLRRLKKKELPAVVDAVRQRHIDVVSEKGGHFGASLGVAELTVALHYVYDTPNTQIVWDTGHQAYIHKILTGRNESLPTIRTRNGLAPFLRGLGAEPGRQTADRDHVGESIRSFTQSPRGRVPSEEVSIRGIVHGWAIRSR